MGESFKGLNLIHIHRRLCKKRSDVAGRIAEWDIESHSRISPRATPTAHPAARARGPQGVEMVLRCKGRQHRDGGGGFLNESARAVWSPTEVTPTQKC